MSKPIILSGMQPTGSLHIGNYLGALKNWVDLQNSGKYESIVFIADLHSLTIAIKPEQLREQTRLLAAEYIAAGIDPAKTIIFAQSHVAEHTELAWIFSTLTPLAELYRMTQFKDKSARDEKNVNAGLLTYPILQAADILLYLANFVPVGQDQVQHLELTRDCARWFNNRYDTFFPEIKPLLTETPKIMSLLEPTKKMSKSAGDNHYVALSDEPEIIEKKLKRAVTATEGGSASPGVQNLLLLLKQFAHEDIYKQFVVAERDGTIRYGDLKQELAVAIGDSLADFRAKRAELLNNPKKLDAILASGAEKARAIAQKTMTKVRELVGVR